MSKVKHVFCDLHTPKTAFCGFLGKGGRKGFIPLPEDRCDVCVALIAECDANRRCCPKGIPGEHDEDR